jgi:hypothetical protein
MPRIEMPEDVETRRGHSPVISLKSRGEAIVDALDTLFDSY